jgi:hypothetical protein
MKLSRTKLIKFYDERVKDEGRGSDVSAITALLGEDLLFGLFKHYWENKEKGILEIVSYTCTTGKKKGPRLDGWLKCETDKENILYQTEIKNWAAYSFGESQLPLNASEDEIEEFRKDQWEYYFGETSILHERVAKVLQPMKKPNSYENYVQIPLCCFWFYIANKAGVSFSRHCYPHGKIVHVFSASAYLRGLENDFIDISMERSERRLELIQELRK